MSKNYLIYTAVTSWNEPPRARHQVTNELKKDGVVYFVEKNKVGIPRMEVKKVEENVYVITPYYWLLYKVRYRIPGVNELYHKWLLQQIKSLQINFEFVVTFDFTAPAVNHFFKNVIFYSADDNVGFGNFNPWFINSYHRKTEAKIAAQSRLCIVTSDYMQTKLRNYNSNTHVVPLGAPQIQLNEEIKAPQKKQPPVLGLVGYLDSNLDFVVIEQLLKRFRINFIGPLNDKNKKWLSGFPNAIISGAKTGEALYEALSEVDVCIAPYDLDKINKGATPNKMWLYLALGKPAVVTNIPNIRSWVFEPKLVYKCENENFFQCCQQAIEDDSMELAQKRIEFARANSWESRVEQIKKLYYQQN